MLSSILVFIMMAYGIFGNAAGLVLSTTPQSRNVSAGTMVEFTCAAPASGLTSFSISTTPTVGGSVTDGSDLPNGDRLITLSFIAPSDQTSISIVCVVTTTTGFNQSLAVLMIQGVLSPVSNLISTTVDSCTLHFTWIAPSSLEGVAISYIINITDTNGAVLRTDTTSTTEYLYSVSSLGETLEIEVAAVNGAGIGNATSIMTQTPLSISVKFISTLMNTTRTNSSTNTNWTYTFEFEETSVCGNAISHVTIEACLNSSCTSTNGTVSMLPDGERRVMATFTDLMENRKYTATLNIHYNGGVVQQSQLVGNLSTFDVSNATYTVEFGRVCFNVTYVEGHVRPARSFSLFQSSTNVHNGTIDQADKCVEVAPHPSYTIKITDEDAKDEIDTVAPVTILGVAVPGHVSSTQNAVSSNTVSTSPPVNDDVTIKIVLPVIIIGLMAAIIATLSVVLCSYCYCKRKPHADNKIKIETNCHSLSDGHQALHQSELNDQRTSEIIYADIGTHSNNTPHPALPVGEVQYGLILMSKGQQECLKRLAKMETLLINYITLYELLQPLSLQWRQLGEALLLAPYLSNIQTKNFSDEERLQAVLKCWEDEHVRPYTWETLVAVLNSSDIRATYLAIELSKRLKHRLSTCL